MSESLTSIQGDGESLKERLWGWIDDHNVPVVRKERVKDAMNGLLDEIDCLEEFQ